MNIIRVIFLGLAFTCFILNFLNITLPKGNLLGLGLAMWALAEIIH